MCVFQLGLTFKKKKILIITQKQVLIRYGMSVFQYIFHS